MTVQTTKAVTKITTGRNIDTGEEYTLPGPVFTVTLTTTDTETDLVIFREILGQFSLAQLDDKITEAEEVVADWEDTKTQAEGL